MGEEKMMKNKNLERTWIVQALEKDFCGNLMRTHHVLRSIMKMICGNVTILV
jgi:hypothetical protein